MNRCRNQSRSISNVRPSLAASESTTSDPRGFEHARVLACAADPRAVSCALRSRLAVHRDDASRTHARSHRGCLGVPSG
jgi:hypothetical protein